MVAFSASSCGIYPSPFITYLFILQDGKGSEDRINVSFIWYLLGELHNILGAVNA